MIFNRNNSVTQAGGNDWHNYYSRDVIARLNMDADGDFTYSGQAPEPRRVWNDDTNRYDGAVTGYGYWLSQNYVNETTVE